MRQFIELVHNRLVDRQKQSQKVPISYIVQLSIDFLSSSISKSHPSRHSCESQGGKGREMRGENEAMEIMELVHECALILESDQGKCNKLISALGKRLSFSALKYQALSKTLSSKKGKVSQRVQDELSKQLMLFDTRPTLFRVCGQMVNLDQVNPQKIEEQLQESIQPAVAKMIEKVEDRLERCQSGNAEASRKQVAAILKEEYRVGREGMGNKKWSSSQVRSMLELQSEIKKRIQLESREKEMEVPVMYQGHQCLLVGNKMYHNNRVMRVRSMFYQS